MSHNTSRIYVLFFNKIKRNFRRRFYVTSLYIMHISRGCIYVLLIYHFFVNVDGCVRSPTWIQLFFKLLAKNMQLNFRLVFCTRCFEFNHDTTLELLASRKNVPHQYDNVLSFIKIWHLVVMQTNWFFKYMEVRNKFKSYKI